MTALEVEALGLSLRVAGCAMVVSLPLALLVAWLLARCDFVGKTVLDGIVHLPLVLPPVVIGYLLLIALGPRGPVGVFLDQALGVSVAFTWQGAAVAAGVMAFPLMVRPIRQSLELIDRRLEGAARTLGSAPWRVFATVTLPLAAPGIVIGMILAFARSLGEFGATITFVSNIPGETRTLPIALYSVLQTPGGDASAIRIVVISVVLAFIALIASEMLSRRVLYLTGAKT